MAKARGRKPATPAETSTVGRDGGSGVAKRGRGNGGNRGGNRGRGRGRGRGAGRGDEAPTATEVSLPIVKPTPPARRSQAPSPEIPAYDSKNSHFSEKVYHDTYYTHTFKKGLIHDRGFHPTDVPKSIKQLFNDRPWAQFTTHSTDSINKSLVREFYARGQSLTSSSDDRVLLRGETVCFNMRGSIKAFFGVSPLAQGEVDYMTQYTNGTLVDMEAEFDRAIAHIAPKGAQWRRNDLEQPLYFPSSNLSEDARFIFHLVCARLLPSSQTSKVHPSRAFLTYLILIGRSFAATSLIWEQIRTQLANPAMQRDLPFGSFITWLAKQSKVPTFDDDEYEPIKAPISLRYFKGHVPKTLSTPPPLPLHPPPESSTAQPSDTHKLLVEVGDLLKAQFARDKFKYEMDRECYEQLGFTRPKYSPSYPFQTASSSVLDYTAQVPPQDQGIRVDDEMELPVDVVARGSRLHTDDIAVDGSDDDADDDGDSDYIDDE